MKIEHFINNPSDLHLKQTAAVIIAVFLVFASTLTIMSIPAFAMTKNEIHNILLERLYGESGGKISCGFDGYTSTSGRHEGIDCVYSSGHSVYSILDGKVTSARQASNGLTTIAIYNSSFDVTIIYLHTKSFAVSTGETVTQGRKIALEGKNGASSAHTHVELRPGYQTSASKSTDDPVLNNPNPYPYYEEIFNEEIIPDLVTVTSYSTESPTSIKINWKRAAGAITYQVYRWEANTNDTYTCVNDDIDATSFTDTGLKKNTRYWYRVYAVNSAGRSDFDHNITDILTSTEVPDKVKVKSYSTESNTSIKINWEPAYGATKYQVDRWQAFTTDTYTIVKSDITGTSYTDTGLMENTQYWYRVRAINGAGMSDFDESTSDILTTTKVLDVPSGVKATGTSTTSITVMWDATPGATSYRIYRWQAWHGDTTATDVELNYTGTKYVDEGLLPGTQYYYRIYANNDKGQSSYSNEVIASTVFEPDCIFPEDLQVVEAEALSDTQVTVIQCPESLKVIGSKAFSGCSELSAIYIPEATTNIAEDAFKGCPDFTIWGKDGSFAQQYAISHGYAFAKTQ